MSRSLLIVGAGLSGATIAQLAAQQGYLVNVIDKRVHLAGNAYDQEKFGILTSLYGAHLFHTNSQKVWDFLEAFAAWRPYQHRVLASVDGKLIPLPIILNTINKLFDLHLKNEAEMRAFLQKEVNPLPSIQNAEDYLLSQLGPRIYQQIFQGYTEKQWGLPPSKLDASIVKRIPLRFNNDDRYFSDQYQALPEGGYTRLVEKMLDHPNISIILNKDFASFSDEELKGFDKIFYSGPIDQYFDFNFGKLEYRSLEFQFEVHDQEFYQSNSVINYPSLDVPYTRIVEYKYFNPPAKKLKKTVISKEIPTWEGDPYYPVPREKNQRILKKYQLEAKKLQAKGIYFFGRLGSYRYLNMDQAIAEAMQLAERIL